MEGLVLETQFFNPTIAAAGLAVLLAVRRIDWLEEPLAMPGDPGRPQSAEGAKLAKAA